MTVEKSREVVEEGVQRIEEELERRVRRRRRGIALRSVSRRR